MDHGINPAFPGGGQCSPTTEWHWGQTLGTPARSSECPCSHTLTATPLEPRPYSHTLTTLTTTPIWILHNFGGKLLFPAWIVVGYSGILHNPQSWLWDDTWKIVGMQLF